MFKKDQRIKCVCGDPTCKVRGIFVQNIGPFAEIIIDGRTGANMVFADDIEVETPTEFSRNDLQAARISGQIDILSGIDAFVPFISAAQQTEINNRVHRLKNKLLELAAKSPVDEAKKDKAETVADAEEIHPLEKLIISLIEPLADEFIKSIQGRKK